MRRMKLQAILVLVATLAVATPPAAATAACSGDCNRDGEVVVNELIGIVAILLGEAAPGTCAAADVDGDGTVMINEAVAAVNVALSACPAPAAEPASAALALTRALLQLPRLSGVVAVGLDSLGGSTDCELGGSVESSCEDSGAGTRRNQVHADACRTGSPEGPVQLDGDTTVVAAGQCPDILIPANIRFMFTGSSVLQSEDGTPLVDMSLDASIVLVSLITGQPPCTIKGGEATVDRHVTVRAVPADRAATLEFETLGLVTEFVDFAGGCNLQQLRSTANGPLRVTDDYGAQSFSVAATLHDMVIGLDVPNRAVRLDGRLNADCLGAAVRLRTIEPLDYHPDQACFTRGVLAIGLPTGTAQVTMLADGGVAVDADGDGSVDDTYASCLDLPRQPCVPTPLPQGEGRVRG